MEKFNIDYSTKNIPIPTKHEYTIQLISNVEQFIKRMRWKVPQFLGKLDNTVQENYGFKTREFPPCVEELTDFENDMIYMVRNIEFRNANNSFQTKLSSDIKRMKTNDNLLIAVDKSRNIYLMSKNIYTKHRLTETVTKTCKQCSRKKVKHINYNSKLIMQRLSINDRIEKVLETEAHITIKDHKEGFPHEMSFRLLNPSESDIGKISKNILD